jgi:hypothetical protein
MLPLPRHLLNIDPEEVVHEIEDDPLSQFVWSFRPNLETLARKPFARLTLWASKPQSEITTCTECGAQ